MSRPPAPPLDVPPVIAATPVARDSLRRQPPTGCYNGTFPRRAACGTRPSTRRCTVYRTPPDGSPPTPSSSGTVQASGRTDKRTRRGKKSVHENNVIQMPIPAPPKFTLTEQEQAFWETLWCGYWFNKDIPPKLNETAYEHILTLAPHITTAEQLDSLVKFARQRLEENTGVKCKIIHLGNLVSSYRGWKQQQPAPEQNKSSQPQSNGTPKRVLTGADLRAARQARAQGA